MPYFNYNNIKITGILAAVPNTVQYAKSKEKIFGEKEVHKFIEMTGIKSIHKTNKQQTASDLGFVAARELLSKKKIASDRIQALVYASLSDDYKRPSTACVLHNRLGLSKECVAFDVGLGCSASVYGIQVMCSMMACSNIDVGLLIVAENCSKLVNPEDKSTSMMIGDGGAAILFERSDDDEKPINALLRTDGASYKSIIVPAGGFRNADEDDTLYEWQDGNMRKLNNLYMNGTDVFSFAISDVPRCITDFLHYSNTSIDDYDIYAIHQANRFIHKQLSKKLKIPFDKMPLSLDRYGNTSAPSIPLTLCDYYGKKNSGSINTLMCGFGVGLSFGVVSACINSNDVFPIVETEEYYEEGIINEPF